MSATTQKIRLLVVDDHEMVREGLKTILKGERDLEIVGESARGSDVIELVEQRHPDVVLLDARLPDLSGPEVTRMLSEKFPRVSVLILSTYTDDELVEACIRAGAKGYIVKDIQRFSLKESIRSVCRGESVLSPQVAGRVMNLARAKVAPSSDKVALNQRQLSILRLIARGYSNREIGQQIHLSENTIKTHVQAILAKLGARNRVEAAIMASKKELI